MPTAGRNDGGASRDRQGVRQVWRAAPAHPVLKISRALAAARTIAAANHEIGGPGYFTGRPHGSFRASTSLDHHLCSGSRLPAAHPRARTSIPDSIGELAEPPSPHSASSVMTRDHPGRRFSPRTRLGAGRTSRPFSSRISRLAASPPVDLAAPGRPPGKAPALPFPEAVFSRSNTALRIEVDTAHSMDKLGMSRHSTDASAASRGLFHI